MKAVGHLLVRLRSLLCVSIHSLSQTAESVLPSILRSPPGFPDGSSPVVLRRCGSYFFKGIDCGKDRGRSAALLSRGRDPRSATLRRGTDVDTWTGCAGSGVRAQGGGAGAGSEETRWTKEEAGLACLQRQEHHVRKQRGVPRPGASVDQQLGEEGAGLGQRTPSSSGTAFGGLTTCLSTQLPLKRTFEPLHTTFIFHSQIHGGFREVK